MRLFNPSRMPRLCTALQEVLFPFEDRLVAPDWEERVRNCPFGDSCVCEKTEETPVPESVDAPKAASRRSVKANEPDEATEETGE